MVCIIRKFFSISQKEVTHRPARALENPLPRVNKAYHEFMDNRTNRMKADDKFRALLQVCSLAVCHHQSYAYDVLHTLCASFLMGRPVLSPENKAEGLSWISLYSQMINPLEVAEGPWRDSYASAKVFAKAIIKDNRHTPRRFWVEPPTKLAM